MPTSDIKKGPLYVDSTNNRVGIGTSSPDTNLDVERSSNDTGGIKVQNTNNAQGSAVAQVEISGGDNAYANLLLECNATNHSIRQDGSGNLKITNGSTERLRIDSSGSVGIGTSSPSSFFSGARQLVVGSGSSDQGVTIYSGTAGNAQIFFADGTSGADAYRGIVRYIHSDNAMTFYTDGANERMRIDSSGNLLVGRTTISETADAGIGMHGGTSQGRIDVYKIASGTYYAMRFYNNTTAVGSINYGNSSTSYNTSSDYRLKENVVADWDATTRLKQLNPVRFNFISDADTTVDGFLAHEVQDIVPEAISGTHDEVDDDGNPVYQGIDQSKLTPLLTKALIEAVEKIEQLEARITALEAN